MSLEKKTAKITIDKTGNFSMQATGVEGSSCVEKTRDLEIVLNGMGKETDGGKTGAYYGEDDAPLTINISK